MSVAGSLALGSAPVANTVTKNLTVKNIGRAPLFILGMSSTDPAEFTPGTSTCPTTGLSQGLSCTVAIGFTPGALGARRATITLKANAGKGVQNVALSGTGLVRRGGIARQHRLRQREVERKEERYGDREERAAGGGGAEREHHRDERRRLCGDGRNVQRHARRRSELHLHRDVRAGAAGARTATISVTAGPDLQSPHNVSLSGTGL